MKSDAGMSLFEIKHMCKLARYCEKSWETKVATLHPYTQRVCTHRHRRTPEEVEQRLKPALQGTLASCFAKYGRLFRLCV